MPAGARQRPAAPRAFLRQRLRAQGLAGGQVLPFELQSLQFCPGFVHCFGELVVATVAVPVVEDFVVEDVVVVDVVGAFVALGAVCAAAYVGMLSTALNTPATRIFAIDRDIPEPHLPVGI